MPRIQLSSLFSDPALRAAFAAAERDQEPDAFTIASVSPKSPRTDGAVAKRERELCIA